MQSDSPDHGLDRQADVLAHGVALMLILTIMQRSVGLLRNVLVCRFLEPDQLGAWNLAQSFLILAAPLIVLGMPGLFARYLEHYRQRGCMHLFLRRCLAVAMITTIVCSTMVFCWPSFFAWLAFGSREHVHLLLACMIVLLAVVLFNTCVELITAMRRVRAVSFLQFANTVLFTLLSIVFIVAMSDDAMAVVLAYGVACVLTGVYAVSFIRRSLHHGPTDSARPPARTMWSRILPFAVWFWASDLLMNLFSTIDRYMIVHLESLHGMDGLTMVGQYHSSRIVGVLLVALTGMVGSIVLSYLSHDWEAGRRKQAKATLDFAMKLTSLALTAVAVVVLCLSPIVFDWALMHKYDDGLRILPLTMSYCIWFGLLAIASNYLWCCERAWMVGLSVLAGLLLNVVLNYFLLPSFGLVGAVLATAVANVATLSLVMYVCRLLGMHYSVGTMVAVAMPAALAGGPLVALATLLAVGYFGLRYRWLLSQTENDRLLQLVDESLSKLLPRRLFDRISWAGRVTTQQ